MKLSVGIGQGRDADRDGVSSSGLPCFGEGRADAHSSGPVSGGEIFPLFGSDFSGSLGSVAHLMDHVSRNSW